MSVGLNENHSMIKVYSKELCKTAINSKSSTNLRNLVLLEPFKSLPAAAAADLLILSEIGWIPD